MKAFINRLIKIFSNEKVLLALRVFLGATFIIASFDKIFYPEHFKAILREYKMLPEIFVPLFAVIFPWIEFLCGVMLALNIFTISNALILTCVQCMFVAAISINLYLGLIHDCGCFDILGFEEDISLIIIFRDLIFAAMTIPIVLFSDKDISKYVKDKLAKRV